MLNWNVILKTQFEKVNRIFILLVNITEIAPMKKR